MSDGKVIGYLAYVTKAQLICGGDSCVIAGSRKKMKSYLAITVPGSADKVTITKARSGDIKRGLAYGASYSFDEESYKRFYPLARKSGIKAGPEDFSAETRTGFHLARVQKMKVSGN